MIQERRDEITGRLTLCRHFRKITRSSLPLENISGEITMTNRLQRSRSLVSILLLALLSGCGGKTSSDEKSKTGKTDSVAGPTKKPNPGVAKDPLDVKIGDKAVTRYLLTNKNGMIVSLIDWGATVTSVLAPDKNGKLEEITLGYKDIKKYETNKSYFGCTVGRYCNRIAKGEFTIDGKSYQLTVNDGPNLLHGGKSGFHQRFWTVAEQINTPDAVGVRFEYVSPDGEEGFPGQVVAEVTYTLTNDNELKITYSAKTDKPTHVNLTNHCYWNLSGVGEGDILGHEVMLNADQVLEGDNEFIPTGKKIDVKGTPWDFTTPRTIGERINDEKLGKKGAKGRGYDHCYIVREGKVDEKTGLTHIATVHDPNSGRVMEIFTDQPGIQFYSGNFLDGSEDSAGFALNSAFCLECQKYPDTPHHLKDGFPTTRLNPGEVYKQTTIHKFSVRN